MQIRRVPSGNMSWIMRGRETIYLPCLADLDHQVGIDHADHLSEVVKARPP